MEIQPRAFGDLLSTWFNVMGKTWKALLVCSLLVFGPAALLTLVGFFAFGLTDLWLDLFDPERLELLIWQDFWAEFRALVLFGAGWGVLFLAASSFVFVSSIRIVVKHLSGDTPNWREASRFAVGRMARVLGAQVLVMMVAWVIIGVSVAVGWALNSGREPNLIAIFVTLVMAAAVFCALIYLGTSWMFLPQGIAIDGFGAVGSLRRSFALVRGRWWATLAFVALTGIIASSVVQILSLVTYPLIFGAIFFPPLLALGYAGLSLFQAPVAAALGVANTIWYLDLRSRREITVTTDLM